MLCKGTGIDLGKCKRGDKPSGLGKERGELHSHGGKSERGWQGLGVGTRAGNCGGAGLLLWLKVLNEGTHMFHFSLREQHFCCQLTRDRHTVKGIFVLVQNPW